MTARNGKGSGRDVWQHPRDMRSLAIRLLRRIRTLFGVYAERKRQKPKISKREDTLPLLIPYGYEAIKEWNSRPKAGELMPDLSGADFGLCHPIPKADSADFRAFEYGYAKPVLSEVDFSHLNLAKARFGLVDLSGAKLCHTNLRDVSFSGVNLSHADLREANMNDAKFVPAYGFVDFPDRPYITEYPRLDYSDLAGARLIGVKMQRATMRHSSFRDALLTDSQVTAGSLEYADLTGAILSGIKIQSSNMSHCSLRDATLKNSQLIGVSLDGADWTNATLSGTSLTNLDLSQVRGLEKTRHLSPSWIDTATLYLSGGKIPDVFLTGCGIPDRLIEYLPSLVGEPLEYYSCFISYSSQDEEFAQQLYFRMRDEHLRVWYAPEDMKGGEKIYEQIDKAIRQYEKLLLVISENSMKSPWVESEIRKARKRESTMKNRVLFPIRLIDLEAIRQWECFDADTGKDLAIEIREYFIPDFSKWKDYDAFENEFKKLMQYLRAPG